MFHGHVSLQEGTGWLFLLYLGPFLPPSWHRSWSTTVLAAPSGHRRSPLLDVGPWGGKMEATQMPRGLGWEINIQTYLYTVVIYISNWMQNMQKDIHMPIISLSCTCCGDTKVLCHLGIHHLVDMLENISTNYSQRSAFTVHPPVAFPQKCFKIVGKSSKSWM